MGGKFQVLSVTVLYETLVMPVLLYGIEIMIWREKQSSRIRAVQGTTSEVCWILEEWIKCRVTKLERCSE